MISVCLTTYNGETYLSQQIDSILPQLGPEDELVVSDDGSTDATPEILRRYQEKDSRVKVFQNMGVHGVNGNFNNAVGHAKGDYIFLSDQDDVWREEKVKSCLAALRDADLVVHDAVIVDSGLHPICESLFSELNAKPGFMNNFIRNRFTGCCMAFRRDILRYIYPFPMDVSFFHDNWIGLLVSLKGKVRFLEEGLILFRRHGANNSSAASESSLGFQDKIGYRVRLAMEILKRL